MIANCRLSLTALVMLPYFYNFKCTVRFICLKHMLIIRMIYLNSSKCSHLIWQNCYYQVLHSWIDLFWKLAWKIESQNYPLQQILFESLNSHEFPDLTFTYIYEVNVPKFQTTSSWTWISKSKSGHRGSSIFFSFPKNSHQILITHKSFVIFFIFRLNGLCIRKRKSISY